MGFLRIRQRTGCPNRAKHLLVARCVDQLSHSHTDPYPEETHAQISEDRVLDGPASGGKLRRAHPHRILATPHASRQPTTHLEK